MDASEGRTDASASPSGSPPRSTSVLSIRGLRTELRHRRATVIAVDGASLDVAPGEAVGLIGESGCGKTALALSVLQLLPPVGRVVAGQAFFEGRDLLTLTEMEMRKVRGRQIAIVFQDALSALHPVFSVGRQIALVLRRREGLGRREALATAERLLRDMELPDPARQMGRRAGELSGGMRQRVLTAMALACRPKLLIADEPTTGLDASTQNEIVALLDQQRRTRGVSLLFISHDLFLLACAVDRIAVMCAGRIVETALARELLRTPRHPYTQALVEASAPWTGIADRSAHGTFSERGSSATRRERSVGCVYADRCSHAGRRCLTEVPELIQRERGSAVACFLYDETGPEGSPEPSAG